MKYQIRANKGRSWIVATPKKLFEIDAFYKNSVQSCKVKIDDIWLIAPLLSAKKIIFEQKPRPLLAWINSELRLHPRKNHQFDVMT